MKGITEFSLRKKKMNRPNSNMIVTKEVIYRCGCKVLLSEGGQRNTANVCGAHREGIKKVITTEEILEEIRVGNMSVFA